MKKILIACFILVNAPVIAQTKADYDATMDKFKSYYNQHQYDSIYTLLSEHSQTVMPLDKTTQTFSAVNGQLGAIRSCEFSKEKDGFDLYKTEFASTTMTISLQLDKNNKINTFRFLPYIQDSTKSNFNLKTSTGTIYGTLTMPKAESKVPVVLIIAGSGPTDRNGNNNMGLATNAYLMLADSLRKSGIACLRYDKRGVGESAGALKDEHSFVFDDIITDAEGFIKMLKEDNRFSKIIVLGHSEGSLIGMVAANKENTNGFISLAGGGENIGSIIEKQKKAESEDAAAETKIIVDSLKKGYDVKNVSPEMQSLFRPSVQPYMKSWLRYDPAIEIKKLKIPILILQGTTDMQVGVEQAEMLKKANARATMTLIKGMNHVLKHAPEDRQQNAATYAEPDLALSPGLMQAILKFID